MDELHSGNGDTLYGDRTTWRLRGLAIGWQCG